MRLTAFLGAAFLIAAPAPADEIKKEFPSLMVKYAGSTYSFLPSVTWTGEKTPQTAKAQLYVSESGASGRITISKVFVTMTPDELRKLHSTLGSMVDAIDGDGEKKKPARGRK